ncbi:TIR-like protein FxsC [Nonomuraea lactucae]|uniref:TIR-like protein FxsC n=1 Tax=Nonomuraea lactucae TaxID=2249762 RepID=UPI000DE48CED|nr:TIR-like protein FxsC [Nonomuraea lactucae]
MSHGRRPGPYFFLSYAHLPQQRFNPGVNLNEPIFKLFAALCKHILHMTNCTDVEAGFMDQKLESGDRWNDQLAEALATCRVFVPVYSPRYFQSEECGKEWAAFMHRVQAHRDADGREPQAIVPVVWHPVPPDDLPDVARPIQFSLLSMDERYLEDGFYGFTELPGLRSHYRTATYALAKRIVSVAKETQVAPCEPLPYDRLGSVFGDYGRRHPLKVTVVASVTETLSHQRDPYYYGHAAAEWNPFRGPGNSKPLAECARELAEVQGYRAEIVGFEQYTEQLLGTAQPEGPAVMLLDAWEATQPGRRADLLRFDQRDRQWVSVVVPWNSADEQTEQARKLLKERLREALPSKYGGPESWDVPSLEAFRQAFPDMVARAASHFFRTARTFPPTGHAARKPRLMEDP